MNKTFHIVTFGCQMNKLDSELLHGALHSRGFEPVEDPERAGVVIYNTCSVRQHAEDRVFSHLGTWRDRARRDPEFVLVVIGCMAQRLGGQIARRFDQVKLICGTRSFLRVPDYLEQIELTGERVIALDEGPVAFERIPQLRTEPHHAYVSVMRGCDNYCSYCIVPYVRGRETSRPPAQILDEVRSLCDSGVVEVTLLGQSISAYGKALGGGASLAGLLAEVNAIAGLRRIRFLTSHPRDMDEGILRAVSDLDKVCEHIHMPAQSGSDAVLARMNRGYTLDHYLRLIRAGHRLAAGLEFSSDFIVGFPGETDEDFELTMSLLEGVRFQQSFVFRYSPRPETQAARQRDDVPDAVKRSRQQRLLSAQERVDTERRASLVGITVEVMSDGPNRGDARCGEFIGRTRQNDIVVFSGRDAPPGAVCRVLVEGSTALTLFGRRLQYCPVKE
jgi:tRNA-2-methylthio-N6-dimethylallyladenosine synthase